MACGSSGPALRRLAENSLKLRSDILDHIRIAKYVESTRVRVDAGKRLGVLEPELDRPVTAHRQAADRTARPFGLHRESPIDKGDDVLDEIVFVREAFQSIGVPAAAAIGHDHDEWEGSRVALDAGAAHPDCMIVGQPVQEIERGPRRREGGIVRKYDVERRNRLE